MNIIDIIVKKKNSEILTEEEIKYVIDNYMNDNIKDYQMSSLLMAIVINGMNLDETIFLTKAMIESGDVINLDELGSIIDKHSTGGVGDKTTLILAPLVASCGVKIAKMSGRGLGHTGGTIDKLEAIEGFKTSLTEEEFINQVKDIGIAITSQTGNLTPADKKIYSLRDVTGTTESIPLIASSIMSKKIASGANNIIIDVKVGNGALMKKVDDARKLSETMIKIGEAYNRNVICVLTNMDEPLGNAIGNGLEVKEAIDVLKGEGPKDITELTLKLAAIMIGLDKKVTLDEALEQINASIENGKAYQKFEELVSRQNGNIENVEIASKVVSVKSSKDGFISHIDTVKLGNIVRNLGAGRISKEDIIDYGVGIVLNKKVGDFVLENEEILKIYVNNKDVNVKDLLECFTIENNGEKKKKLIIDIIGM